MLKCQIIGNIGGDPQLQYTANGNGRLTFNVASNGRVKGQSGEWEDKTEWVRCTVLGRRAETLSNLLRKGMRVFVGGRLEARPWTDQQGNIRAGLEILADDVEFASSRQDEGQAPRASVTDERRRPQQGQDDDLEDAAF
jgi:single-strand DNA-binding protein